MRDVVTRVQDFDLVLKGGTALAFTRGLNRHSTDLDCDTNGAVELRDQIDGAARAAGVSLGPTDRTDWSDHQRFLAPYLNSPGPNEAMFFKVNVRFRHRPRIEDIEVVEGIRTYSVPALFDQKLAAASSRVEPRDLFDLAFIAEHYGDSLGDDQIRRADALTEDLDRLERRYKVGFEADEVLRELSSIDEVLLRFRYATTDQIDRRWPKVQEQRIPIPNLVLGRVFTIQNRARLAAQDGTEPHNRAQANHHGFLPSLRDRPRKPARQRDVDLDWPLSR